MMRLLTLVANHWIAITLFFVVVIAFFSLRPVKEVSVVSEIDKVYHFLAYATLALPTALRKPNRWIFIGLLLIAYGGALELLQPQVNRYAEWSDMFANTAGVIFGFLIAEVVYFLYPAISNRSGK